jgi:hypothetical protein
MNITDMIGDGPRPVVNMHAFVIATNENTATI